MRLTILILLLACTNAVFAQVDSVIIPIDTVAITLDTPTTMPTITQAPMRHQKLMDDDTYSVGDRTYTGSEINRQLKTGKALLITGAVLTVTGPPLVVGGVFLAASGVSLYGSPNVPRLVGGGILIVTGALGTLSGLPMLLGGAIHYEVWNNRRRNAQLVAGITPMGNVGLCMKF